MSYFFSTVKRSMYTCSHRVGLWVILAATLLVSQVEAQSVNYAQTGDPPDLGLGLLQEEPHDLVFFTEASGGGWAKVFPISFPGVRPRRIQRDHCGFRFWGSREKNLLRNGLRSSGLIFGRYALREKPKNESRLETLWEPTHSYPY